MKLGYHPTSFAAAGSGKIAPRIKEVIQHVEQAGFDTLWAMDHLFQVEQRGHVADEEMLEGYALLTWAAGFTTTLRLGPMVAGVTYRYPGVLIKTATSLDVLSEGRSWFGIGAGWYEREHHAFGVPFPPLKDRFELMEETLQLALQLWGDETGPYQGKHLQLTETLNNPQPVQQPHPPIMIGGSGEKKTLRMVAQYADGCNLFDTPEAPRKLEVLREHCANLGRPYEAIQKTIMAYLPLNGTGEDAVGVEQVLEKLANYAAMGFDQTIAIIEEPANLAVIDLFGEQIIPAAEKMPVAGR